MVKGYLGCDVGSVSVKMAVVDKEYNVLAEIYLENNGLIDTVKKALTEIKNQIKDKDIEIAGVGCTGSGRKFTKVILGADIVKTEILSHTVATLHWFPNVSTIFDIGGEDCKLITLKRGVWQNYIMNNICGAGTGSMIENIARTLDVGIEDVGDLALQSNTNLMFPGKCGILCQSAVISRKNKGANKADILMGVCRALINNYLTLAKSIDLHPPFVFQGATAKNKALVKALEEQLNHEVFVHEKCGLMGAIGMGILTCDNINGESGFMGFDMVNHDIDSETRICDECSNNCEIISILKNNKSEVIGTIGSRCGKY